MALATSPRQKRFLGQLAWERGLKATAPTTSTEASKLINDLMAGVHGAPVVIADWQQDAIRERIVECIEKVDGFNAAEFSEMPADRASANQAIRELDRRLNKATWRNTDTSVFVTKADEAAPVAAESAPSEPVVVEDVPF